MKVDLTKKRLPVAVIFSKVGVGACHSQFAC